jgi:hypothetical protein
MKKFLATIVLVVYAVMSTGFVVSLHYCMDKVNSVELGHSTSDNCDRCGMHKDGHCCWDDVKVVKIQSSHLNTNTSIEIPSLAPALATGYDYVLIRNFQVLQANDPIAHGPPLDKQDTYLTNCVFRI